MAGSDVANCLFDEEEFLCVASVYTQFYTEGPGQALPLADVEHVRASHSRR